MSRHAQSARPSLRRLSRLWLPLLAAVLLASPASADNGRGRHKKVYVVPTPGTVTIDGKLDDWDLSGQLLMYVVSETIEMQSARFATMYDGEAWYFSGVVKDPSPMMNRHDPAVDPDKAWDADVCQIFLSLDPALGYPVDKSSFAKDESDKMATLLLWHYTDRAEANLVALKAMTFNKGLRPDLDPRGVIPRDKFQGAYRKNDDGRGYTFEYRIPWATLGVAAPKAGDLLAMTVCFFWGTPDGLKTAGGGAWCYDVMSGPGFPFQSSNCWGKVIFSAKGSLPREMVEEGVAPERPLPLEFVYDLPADAEATIQLFDGRGMVARTLVAQGERRAGRNIERWDGLGDDGKLLPAGDYLWKGLYHGPIKTKFVLAAHNSGRPPYKTDDNTGGWGGDHGSAMDACAVPGGVLLSWNACESGWGIIRTDLTGRKLWGSKHCATYMATEGQRLYAAGDHGFEGGIGVKVFDLADCRPLNYGNNAPQLLAPAGGDETKDEVTGLAAGDGKVYVAYAGRDLIGVFDAAAGTLLASWPLPAPKRLALRADGSLLAVSNGAVVAVAADGKVSPFIAEHLDDPRGLAVATGGTVAVANGGKLQNVALFDAAGTYLRSVGKPGGRPAVGRYDKSGMLEPGGIAFDAQGRLWVAERLDAPKRQSVWDPATGACVDEFFGGSSYFGWAYMDPEHPDELYCHNVLWKIDLAKGSCVPWSTIWRPTAPNMIQQPNPGGYAGHFRVMTAKNGRQYGWGMIDYSNMLFIREGDVFKPFAGTIRVAFGQYGGGMLYPAMKELYEKTKAGAYLWQDANNDQTVQPEELVVSPAGRGETVFNWIDPDLNVWCDAGWMYKPVRTTEDGRPVYDFAQQAALPAPFKGSNANGTSLIYDPDQQAVYTLAPGQTPGFARWQPDGTLVWGYDGILPWNSALNLPMLQPGKLYGLTMPLGVAGDFTGAANYFGPYHLFTRDGLFVAQIMRDGRSGGLGPDITASEVVTGQLVKPKGMERYFLLAGDQDGRVTEILGLDTVKRLPGGAYAHTEAQVQAAAKAQAEYAALVAKSQRLEIVRGRQRLADAPAVGKAVDDRRRFQARAAYDAENLYIGFDVAGPFELVNAIADPKLIFKGGNLLDIQLATDPAAEPQRKTPAPGDLRLLVTRQDGKPVAVAFRPKVKGFAGEPIVLSSPTGKESFDAIAPVPDVKLEYKKTADGFSAVVTIPLAWLGWTPKPGTEVRMDLGCIFGNAQGNQAAARVYWTNNGFSANVTNDIPNESRLEPAEWGTATVE